jgi:hypothetical protein
MALTCRWRSRPQHQFRVISQAELTLGGCLGLEQLLLANAIALGQPSLVLLIRRCDQVLDYDRLADVARLRRLRAG